MTIAGHTRSRATPVAVHSVKPQTRSIAVAATTPSSWHTQSHRLHCNLDSIVDSHSHSRMSVGSCSEKACDAPVPKGHAS